MLTVAPGPIHHIQLATGVPAPPKGEEYPAPTEAVLALAADAVLAKTVSHGKRTAIPCYYAIMLSFDRTLDPPGPSLFPTAVSAPRTTFNHTYMWLGPNQRLLAMCGCVAEILKY